MNNKYQEFVDVLKSKFTERTGLCEPEFQGNEVKYLKECIDTGWVSTAGKFVTEFEEKIKKITGCKFAIATSTGTSALHTLYLAAGIKSGEEVLTQSLTFIATVNAISYCGAVPHFIDIEDNSTLTIDPVKLKLYLKENTQLRNGECYNKNTNRKISALVVMHTFGKATKLEECLDVCNEFKIKLLEDAAEALGTKYKGTHVGAYGAGGVFSFNGNKIVTCGGGGVVVTNNLDVAEKARHLSTTAKKPHKYLYEHTEVGYNYRMPNLNAAVGLAQLERLDKILEAKRQIWRMYSHLFSSLSDIELLGEEVWSNSNNWLMTVRLKDCTYETLLGVLEELNNSNISVRPIWKPIHQLGPYINCPKSNLSVTEVVATQVINVPSSPFLVNQVPFLNE